MLSSSLNLRKGQPPLVMERFDLLEVWRPYLIVKGLEEWMIEDVDMIKDHFQAEANGAQIQSIDVHGSETIIMFASPQGTKPALGSLGVCGGHWVYVEVTGCLWGGGSLGVCGGHWVLVGWGVTGCIWGGHWIYVGCMFG